MLQVRAALDEGAGDAALRPLIEEARGQLWTLFAMKKAVVCSESVLLIIYLEHLLPPVREKRLFQGFRVAKLGSIGSSGAAVWTLFAMKKAVVCSESVLLIIYLEHLLPPVRASGFFEGFWRMRLAEHLLPLASAHPL